VQPSFLTGGLDPDAGLGADLGDDLIGDHHHDRESLVALASALATPPSTTANSSGPQAASSLPAELNAPSAAAPQAGWTTAATAASAGVVAHQPPRISAVPAPQSVPVTVGSVTAVQNPVIHGSLTGTFTGSKGGDPTPPSVVWAGYQSDPVRGQWNAVLNGTGASAGYIFLGGTSTDPTSGVTAATVEKLRSDGTTDATTFAIRFELPYSAYRGTDAVGHLALSPDGSRVYATANISTSTEFGFTGLLASVDVTAPRADVTGFADTKFNGVAVSGTADSYSVLVSGTDIDTTRPNGTDLLVAGFDPTLTSTLYAHSYGFLQGGVAVDTAGLVSSQDSSGAQYVGGTLTMGNDTRGLFAKFDNQGALVWNFSWTNSVSGPGGAVNGVFESAGFLYMTGTLNSSGAGSVHQDMILAKVSDLDGSITGGWAFEWIAGTRGNGDLPGESIVVRNGEPFTAGRIFDPNLPPGPDMESAALIHFTSTGYDVVGNPAELGGSGFDNAYGLDFATPSGTDLFWAGDTTSTDLPVTDGSVYGGGLSDGWASRWVV
jgi:hypothetical protein